AAAGVRSYRRRASLETPGPAHGATEHRPIVQITDTWQLDPVDGEQPGAAVVLNQVIAGEILDHRPGLLRVRALSHALVEICWDRERGAASLERRTVEDPLLVRSWGEAVHRLRLTGPARGTATLTVQAARAGTEPRPEQAPKPLTTRSDSPDHHRATEA